MRIFKRFSSQKYSGVTKPNKSTLGGNDKKAELARRLRSISRLSSRLSTTVEECAGDIENAAGSEDRLQKHVDQVAKLMQLGNAMMAEGRQDAALQVLDIARELNALL